MTRAQATKHSRDGNNVHSHLNETIPQKKKAVTHKPSILKIKGDEEGEGEDGHWEANKPS